MREITISVEEYKDLLKAKMAVGLIEDVLEDCYIPSAATKVIDKLLGIERVEKEEE